MLKKIYQQDDQADSSQDDNFGRSNTSYLLDFSNISNDFSKLKDKDSDVSKNLDTTIMEFDMLD